MSQILVEKTIEKYGYDPNDLKPSSCKLVVWCCGNCFNEVDKKFRMAKKNLLCLACSNKINAVNSANKRSISVTNWYKTNKHPLLGTKRPEHIKIELEKGRKKAHELQKTVERRKILSDKVKGENNPMYGKKHSEESINKIREFQKMNPLNKGKNSNFYGKQYHGKGNWYFCKDGSKVWMRSSWEIKFAKYLDENNIDWLYEPKVFPIFYNDKDGTYKPDFYLIKEDKFIEIKGWWRDDAKIKFDSFVNQYSKIKIELYDKYELKKLNIL